MRAARQHRAGIEARIHLHDRDAGFAVSGEERALDRRRAAPARQQRGVDVERAVRRGVEQRAAAGSVHRRRRPARPAARRARARSASSRFQSRRLEDGEAARVARALDRTRRRLAGRARPAGRAGSGPARRRALRQQARSAPLRRTRACRRRRGAGRRGQADLRSCLASLARMRCCLSCDRCSTKTLPFR